MTKLGLPETRARFFRAFRAAIAAAPPTERGVLGDALEDFAAARGRRQYERITGRSPILAELLDVVAEECDARLFIDEG